MPGMFMLVSKATVPASIGLPAGSVNVSTKVFLPTLSCPASLASVITASFVFWVWMGFRSAAGAEAVIPAKTSRPVTRVMSRGVMKDPP